ncbi:MAG: 3-deoxy-7-phosphoheptulonate synthase [Elusimicrobia bacterium]|nr:3-deoxy-7-phosphoheptulonate synthase [Elusimicrobiota bacterium]
MLINLDKSEKKRAKRIINIFRKDFKSAKVFFTGDKTISVENLKKGEAPALFSQIKAVLPKSEIICSAEELYPDAVKSKFSFDKKFEIIAGPCAVEDIKSYLKTASFLKSLGLKYIRGPIFKPRQSPYSFQGLEEKGIEILKEAKEKYSLKIVTEVLSAEQTNKVRSYCDIFQVGAANMRNYPLLKTLSESDKPVLLKRAQCATIKDWLSSAEYLAGKNKNIIFCERGDYPLFPESGVNFNLAGKIKKDFSLCVIADISHSSLGAEFVFPGALAARYFGLDGIMVEIHENPQKSKVDGKHALNFKDFEKLIKKIKSLG